MNIRFLTSAALYDQLPEGNVPEVCFLGRSNVGKSSLINALANQNKLAKTSSTPGKTRLFNYFTVDDDRYFWVDLPGYGYAKVSHGMKEMWDREILRYLKTRTQLRVIVQLIDARHGATKLDKEMMLWMAENARPFVCVLTKQDKHGRQKQREAESALREVLKGFNVETLLVSTSSEKRMGMDGLRQLLDEFVNDDFEMIT